VRSMPPAAAVTKGDQESRRCPIPAKIVLEEGKKLPCAPRVSCGRASGAADNHPELIGALPRRGPRPTKNRRKYTPRAGEEITGTERKDGEWDIAVGKTPLKA